MSFSDLCTPDRLEHTIALFQHGVSRRTYSQLETALIRKDGRRVEVWVAGEPVIADGQITAIHCTAKDITERKRAEEAVASREREFRLLAESMPLIVWTTQADGLNTYFNQKWVEYTGLALEESYGTGWNRPFHPDDKQRAWDAWQNAVVHNAPYLLQCRLRRADGIYRWWLIHGVPVLDGDGKISKWFGTCTDIDDIKRAEQALFETNQRLTALMNALPVGVSFSDDATCQHITGNPCVLEQFDVRSEDNLSASATAANAPGRQLQFFRDGQPITDADLPLQRAVAENRTIAPMELEVHLPNGRRWFASASGAPVRDRAGQVVGGVAVTADITAHKQAQESLRESERRMQMALETSRSFAFEWEPASDRVLRSDSCSHVLALTGDEARHDTGQRFFERVHLEDRDRFMRTLGELQPSADTYHIEYRVIRGDGVIAVLEESGRGIFDADGNLRRLIGVSTDITDRKQREVQLAKLTRLYTVLSQVNETIVRARDTETLFSEVCRIVADKGGFPLVWIGERQEELVLPVAWSGSAAEYVQGLRVEMQGERGNGPTGTCLRENRGVVNGDFTTNPATSPWREAALRYGFRASCAFPPAPPGRGRRRADVVCLRSRRV